MCESVESFSRTVFRPFTYLAIKLPPREDLTCGKVRWLKLASLDDARALRGVAPLLPTSMAGKSLRSRCLIGPLSD